MIVSSWYSVPHILIFFETRRLNLVWSQKHIKFSILWIANQIFSFLLNEYCFWRSFQIFIRGCLFHCRWIVLKGSHTFWNLQRVEKICITVFYWIINFEHILEGKMRYSQKCRQNNLLPLHKHDNVFYKEYLLIHRFRAIWKNSRGKGVSIFLRGAFKINLILLLR